LVPPVVIDRRVAQSPVEPRHHPVVGQVVQASHVAHECVLKDVFRQGAIADPPGQLIQKAAVVLEEYGERASRLMNLCVLRDVCGGHAVSI